MSEITAQVLKILNVRGGRAAQKAREILLEGVKLEELQAPMKFLADHWSDPTRPALIALSCKAVGGEPARTVSIATAMTLLCSAMNIYDDIMDRSKLKRFVPTLPGRFGDGYALIVGGLVTSKAFFVLDEGLEKEAPPLKRQIIRDLFKDFLYRMSEAEAENLRLIGSGNYDSKEKLHVFEMRSVDIETCMKLGAVIGCAERGEVECLGAYGSFLGTVIELQEDCVTSLNLTINLDNKIRDGDLPYPLIWAMNHNETARKVILSLTHKEKISPADIRKVIETTLETGALDHVQKLSKKITERAVQKLSEIKDSKTKDNLQFLAEAQHHSFVISLNAL